MWNENKSCKDWNCHTGMCWKMMMPMIIIVLLIIIWVVIYWNSTKKEVSNTADNVAVNTQTQSSHDSTTAMMNDDEENMEWEWEEWDKMMDTDKDMMKSDEKTTDMMNDWYKVYSPDLLSSTKTNVLFFAATWCPNCQAADKNFSSETIPDNINLLKVDYDTYTDLKQKYGIVMQHTFVEVDQNWNEIKKWSWTLNVEDLVKEI